MSTFNVAAAQFAPVKGNIADNLDHHIRMIDKAHEVQVQALVFPELSLTGYELNLAEKLSFGERDSRLRPLREQAEKNDMTVCAGAPIKNGKNKPYIGLFILRPNGTMTTYRKINLTDTEKKFCSAGWEEVCIPHGNEKLGVAICADLGDAGLAAKNAELGASIYLSSVLATDDWYDKDAARLSTYAKQHGFLSVLANYCGPSGPYTSNGKSAIWTPSGELLIQADSTTPSLVMARKDGMNWKGRVVSI